MSHVVVPHVADWLGDDAETEGSVGYLLTKVPLWDTDALPSPSPSVYDEWRDDWVALGELPDADDVLAEITTPCIAVQFRSVTFPKGPEGYAESTGMVVDGLISLSAFIAVRGPLKADSQRYIGYLARATMGSLYALGYGTDTNRTVVDQGVRLGRVQSMSRNSAQQQKGDITLVTGWDVSYAITETIPVST